MANVLETTLAVGEQVAFYDANRGTNVGVSVAAGGGGGLPGVPSYGEFMSFDNNAAVAPGGTETSTPIVVPMHAAFIAGTALLLAANATIAPLAFPAKIRAQILIEFSIDGGVVWNEVTDTVYQFELTDPATSFWNACQSLLGEVAFAGAPTGDSVRFRCRFLNDALSTQSVAVQFGVPTTLNLITPFV